MHKHRYSTVYFRAVGWAVKKCWPSCAVAAGAAAAGGAAAAVRPAAAAASPEAAAAAGQSEPGSGSRASGPWRQN